MPAACKVAAIWRLRTQFSSLCWQAHQRTKKLTGNGSASLSLTKTKTSSGVRACSANSALSERIWAACSTMSPANVEPSFASHVANSRINLPIATQQNCGIRRRVPSQKMSTGSQRTPNCARSATGTLKRTRAATTWPVRSAATSSAGFAWEIGRSMAQLQAATTNAICTRRRRKIRASRRRSKSVRTPKPSYSATCGTTNGTLITIVQESSPLNCFQWSSKNAFCYISVRAILRRNSTSWSTAVRQSFHAEKFSNGHTRTDTTMTRIYQKCAEDSSSSGSPTWRSIVTTCMGLSSKTWSSTWTRTSRTEDLSTSTAARWPPSSKPRRTSI